MEFIVPDELSLVEALLALRLLPLLLHAPLSIDTDMHKTKTKDPFIISSPNLIILYQLSYY
jgi:hypothetical protein